MAHEWDTMGVRLKEDRILPGWDVAEAQDPETTAADLAHAILFGKAQAALEAVAAGGTGLTTDHARALHFANEMAELRHYGPLIAVEDGLPALAPGVRHIIDSFDERGLWDGQPRWML
ncbi:hypothetical protein [Arthrobacter sp. B1805]|uniref:hypothetical protein n=1 Tax=Arthrobacter sp. B1805 TaxID=2058892 RepID=UPI000CE3C31C|nr:hypothetical protein [Arthrobacter sp. B1805]